MRTALTFAVYSTRLAGQPFGAEILRIIDNKRLFVVRFGAGQVVGNLLLHAFAAEHYVDVLNIDRFRFRGIQELSVEVRRDCVADLRATIFNRFERRRVLAQLFHDAFDVFIFDRPHAA